MIQSWNRKVKKTIPLCPKKGKNGRADVNGNELLFRICHSIIFTELERPDRTSSIVHGNERLAASVYDDEAVSAGEDPGEK